MKDTYRADYYIIHQRIVFLTSCELRNTQPKYKTTIHDILGCDTQTLKTHIESQFTSGMNWNNRKYKNGWHIDHIIPVSKMKDINSLIALNHYTNLQPLWDFDNTLKHSCIDAKHNNTHDLYMVNYSITQQQHIICGLYYHKEPIERFRHIVKSFSNIEFQKLCKLPIQEVIIPAIKDNKIPDTIPIVVDNKLLQTIHTMRGIVDLYNNGLLHADIFTTTFNRLRKQLPMDFNIQSFF